MRVRGLAGLLVAGFAAVFLVPFGASASSFTITVDSLSDTVAVDGHCILREAIENHNAQGRPNVDCRKGHGTDRINFSLGGTIGLVGELPAVQRKLLIYGGSAVVVDGNATSRILETTDGANLTLANISLTNGSASGDGGALLNDADAKVRLDHVAVTDSTATGSGGGVYSPAGRMTIKSSVFDGNSAVNAGGLGGLDLKISDSTFNDNDASQYGGAMYTFAISMTDSVVSNNTAGAGFGGLAAGGPGLLRRVVITGNSAPAAGGGGIQAAGGTRFVADAITVDDNTAACFGGGLVTFFGDSSPTVVIQNSTISGNQTTSSCGLGGGGLFNQGAGTLIVANSTVADNTTTTDGGGIWNNGTMTLLNDTIANNSAANNGQAGGLFDTASGTAFVANTAMAFATIGTGCGGPGISSGGNNLDEDSTCNFTGPGDLQGLNPFLGSLQNNGGPTNTMLPASTSPLLNRGNSKICSAQPVNGEDQRGFKRPQGGRCDIGSVERRPSD